MTAEQAAELHELLLRALYDLSRGWSAAAFDVICRALRVLAEVER